MQMSWNTSKEAKFDSISEQRVKTTKISGREPAFLMLCIHVGRLIGARQFEKAPGTHTARAEFSPDHSLSEGTAARENVVSETKPQGVLIGKTPQIWAEFSPTYPDQEEIAPEIPLYPDSLPVWVF